MGLSESEQKEYDEKGIKKHFLIDGAYYNGNCRNSGIARWNGKNSQFYYIRQKFGSTFIESLPGPEDAIDGLDYFLPESLNENPGFEIEYREDENG